MTLPVKLSQLTITAEEFAARVLAHFERLVEYYRHLEGVKADAANPDLAPEEKRVAFPPPSEEPTIEKAIRVDDGKPVIDYELQGPTLAEKKAALTAHVRDLEAKAHSANMPPAKVRHWHFREADIHAADQQRVEQNPERVDNAFAFMAETRPAEDTAFLEQHQARKDNAQGIARWAAKLEHDIDDLTEANIDAFVVAPFNG